MGRTVGGFFAGFLTAMIVVILCQSLNLVLYPLPESLDPQDTEALAAHIANSPTGALLGVLAARTTARAWSTRAGDAFWIPKSLRNRDSAGCSWTQ